MVKEQRFLKHMQTHPTSCTWESEKRPLIKSYWISPISTNSIIIIIILWRLRSERKAKDKRRRDSSLKNFWRACIHNFLALDWCRIDNWYWTRSLIFAQGIFLQIWLKTLKRRTLFSDGMRRCFQIWCGETWGRGELGDLESLAINLRWFGSMFII